MRGLVRSGPISGIRNSRPPARLLAEPMELTTQSILSPWRAPAAGMVAVTVTRATFLASLISSRLFRPSGSPITFITFSRLRRVGRKLLPSPVPFKPTTIPNPCKVFSSCPFRRQMLFRIVRASNGAAARQHVRIVKKTTNR